MQMQGSFNAAQFEPNQGFGIHPPAQKIPFTITGTQIKQNNAGDGGYFNVEFTTPLGIITNIYNLWSKTPKAVEIAHGQLSALCRAVSRFQIEWTNEGAALRGATGLLDVGYQKDEEPSAEFPNRKGYTEVKRVYDPAGNDPARPGAAQAQPQVQNQPQTNQPAPMQQQPGGGWGNQAPQGQANPAPSNGGWQGGQQAQPQQQAAPQQQAQPQQNGQAWQPGATAPAGAPPWGNR